MRTSKHGTRYAQGSHATYGGWEPRLCTVCAERVTIKAGGLWMRRLRSEPVALHHHCAAVWFAGLAV